MRRYSLVARYLLINPTLSHRDTKGYSYLTFSDPNQSGPRPKHCCGGLHTIICANSQTSLPQIQHSLYIYVMFCFLLQNMLRWPSFFLVTLSQVYSGRTHNTSSNTPVVSQGRLSVVSSPSPWGIRPHNCSSFPCRFHSFFPLLPSSLYHIRCLPREFLPCSLLVCEGRLFVYLPIGSSPSSSTILLATLISATYTFHFHQAYFVSSGSLVLSLAHDVSSRDGNSLGEHICNMAVTSCLLIRKWDVLLAVR